MTMNYIELSKAVVTAARPCFDDADTDFVDSEMHAGEYFLAVMDTLEATAREGHALPGDLLDGLRSWLAGHDGGVPDLYRDKFTYLLNETPVDLATGHRRTA